MRLITDTPIWHYEPIKTIFTTHAAGRVTVDRWSERETFSEDFLEKLRGSGRADVHAQWGVSVLPGGMCSGFVRLVVSNGWAHYRVVGRDEQGRIQAILMNALRNGGM